jgi:GDPmannose 4,6-dehydratase
MKKALITGITGQDGSYLAELLLSRGYEVHGIVRPSTTRERRGNIAKIEEHAGLHLHQADMATPETIVDVIRDVEPDEVYNLAGVSHVTTSFELPAYTASVNATAVVQLLEGIRRLGGRARFYQASSSEIFGGMPGTAPQSETTPIYPRSPYGVAKMVGYWATRHYREAYGLHASNGILFNHESPRRGENFVTRKIAIAAARIAAGLQERLTLGTYETVRDWGYAPEYVEAMTRMLAAPEGGDYVVATGEAHAVRFFVETAFAAVGMPLTWHGQSQHERAEDDHGRVRVELDPSFIRPAEVMMLQGDPRKAASALGWRAQTRAPELARLMVEHEVRRLA